jgi:iron(III) transport system permease protein
MVARTYFQSISEDRKTTFHRRPGILPSAQAVLLVAVAAYLASTALWPLTRLFALALGPGEEGRFLGTLIGRLQARATLPALANTLEVSALATFGSLLLGTVGAILVSLTDIRGRALVVFALLLPLLVPSQITALAWIGLTGSSSPILAPLGIAPAPGTTNPLYSKWGIVLVMAVEHAGLVFLTVRAGLVRLPRDIVEAARLSGASSRRILRSILMPLALPSILAGGALAFVASIGNFGVPAFLGIPGRVPMLTTLIYQRLQGFGPNVLPDMAALGLLLTIVALAGLAARAFVSRRFASIAERSGRSVEPFILGHFRLSVEIATWTVLLCVSILPLVALLANAVVPALGVPLTWQTVTLANFRFVLMDFAAAPRAFVNSFTLASLAAGISVAIALCLAYLAAMRRNRVARALDLVTDVPYAIPGTVLAIAIIVVFLPPLPAVGFSIYNTFWIILVAYLARFLALAMRPAMAAMEELDPALDEAAQSAGAGVMRRLSAVIVPNVAPALGAGAVLIFMQAFNELTVSALLWSTGRETLGVVIFFLHREGNSIAAAALATVALCVTLALVGVVSLFSRFLPKGSLPWQV